MATCPAGRRCVHVPALLRAALPMDEGWLLRWHWGRAVCRSVPVCWRAPSAPSMKTIKAALLKARDSRYHVTGALGGTAVRVLKNRMSREYVRQEKAGADKMALERFTLGSLRKAVFDGDTENGSLMAGQAAGLLHEVRPVEEILAAMVSEAKDCIAGVYKEITL